MNHTNRPIVCHILRSIIRPIVRPIVATVLATLVDPCSDPQYPLAPWSPPKRAKKYTVALGILKTLKDKRNFKKVNVITK